MSQITGPDNLAIRIIPRVLRAVENGHFGQVINIKSGEAGGINAELLRIGAPLVMGINPAGFAEIMLRGFRAELIAGEIVLTRQNVQIVKAGGYRNNTPTKTHRAGTAPRGLQPVRELDPECHRPAVTGPFKRFGIISHIAS